MTTPIKLTTVLIKEAARQFALAWINEAIESHAGDIPEHTTYWLQREEFHNIFNTLEWPNEGIKVTIELIAPEGEHPAGYSEASPAG